MGQRILSVFALLMMFAGIGFAEVHDGKLFDPGVERTTAAENAPEGLDKLADFVGDWDVELEIFAKDQEPQRSTGRARVTYMNRGHNFMERTRFADFDGQGHSMATMAFIAVSRAGVWAYGEGNSWTEAVTLATGGFEGDRLVTHDSMRPGGSVTLLLIRRSLGPNGEGGFVFTSEVSQDAGAHWATTMKRTYRRPTSATEADFFAVRDDVGMAAPGRPAEAAQFDFLLGEYDTKKWLATPQRVLRWPDHTTAVHVLDGHAILEFGWNDLDPSLPDAASSILRIYNRSMRRWETLYLTNRASAPLYFGGVQEGDRIVLHPFDAQTGSNPLSQWIFFDVREDAYRWKGLSSRDRGETFRLTWGIDFQRKGTTAVDAAKAEPSEIHTVSADGVTMYGDHYRPAWPGATTVVLHHQAGGDARGEYGDIARRLLSEGYEVIAWDARSGGERFGQSNRTFAALGVEETPSYCAAYPDLEAGLRYAETYGGGGPIVAVGSSYSAALVIRLAAEHGSRLAGVAAFSPASGNAMGECSPDQWLPKVVDTPVLAFRPTREAERDSVKAQIEQFNERGVEVFVAADGVHGASMLNPAKVDGDVEPTWERFLAFLADPTASPAAEE